LFKDPEDYKEFVKDGQISGMNYDMLKTEYGTSDTSKLEPACNPPENCDYIFVHDYVGKNSDGIFYCSPTDSYLPVRPKGSFTQPSRVTQKEIYHDYCSHASVQDSEYCKNKEYLAKNLKIKLIGDSNTIFYQEIIEVNNNNNVQINDMIIFDDLDVSGVRDDNWNKFYLKVPMDGYYSFGLTDYEGDGTTDFVESENCVTGGVSVYVDPASLEKYKGTMENNHNFCYTYTPAWRQVTSKVLIVLTWGGELVAALSSVPAAPVVVPLAQGIMAFVSTKLTPATSWPSH
jgi:hypothetical protein